MIGRQNSIWWAQVLEQSEKPGDGKTVFKVDMVSINCVYRMGASLGYKAYRWCVFAKLTCWWPSYVALLR